MHYLIVSLISLFAGSAGAAYLFRRHYRNVQFELEQRKEALRTIMYRTHHQKLNPVCKRIRGITTLGVIVATKRLPESVETDEVITYFKMIEIEARDLEIETLDIVKEFEHLQ
jgi:hypothetical protein